jgi:hypothetical protein
MAGRCQTFREEQGGHSIEACIVEAIHPGVDMTAVEQQDGLREGFARPIEDDTGRGCGSQGS